MPEDVLREALFVVAVGEHRISGRIDSVEDVTGARRPLGQARIRAEFRECSKSALAPLRGL